MTDAEFIVSSIIENIFNSLPITSQKNCDTDSKVQEIVTSFIEDLLLEITEDDNTSVYSEPLFTLPEDNDEEHKAKDLDPYPFQVVPVEEIKQVQDLDEIRFYDELPSKSKPCPVEDSDQLIEEMDEILQVVPNDTGNLNLTIEDGNDDRQSKIVNEISESGDRKSVSPLKVTADSLVMNFKSYADAGAKRKHENDIEEIVYHTQLQVAMPNLLNAVPRLGLSKYSKLPKLHKRTKI